MKQLTRLETIKLYKENVNTLEDGDFEKQLEEVGSYKVISQELDDNVSATVYGSDLDKMIRISSVNKILEILLKSKMNNTEDNITKYKLSFDNTNFYKIKIVKSKYIDIERL